MPLINSDLLALVRRRPFQPFRLFVDDPANPRWQGASYDIRHPDQLLVTRDAVIVGLRCGEEDVFALHQIYKILPLRLRP